MYDTHELYLLSLYLLSHRGTCKAFDITDGTASLQPEAVREAGVWAEKYCRGRDCTIASFLLCRRAISFFVVNQFPSFPIVIDN